MAPPHAIGDEDADTDWHDPKRKYARRRHRPSGSAGPAAGRPARRGDPEASRYAWPTPFGQGGPSPRCAGAAHRGPSPRSQISAPSARDRPRLRSASGRGGGGLAPPGTTGDRKAAWRRRPRATAGSPDAKRAIGRVWEPHDALAHRRNSKPAASAADAPASRCSADAPAERPGAAAGDAEKDLRRR